MDEIPDYAALGRLDGRAFVVIGAGAGIGRQSALALAQAGARVACVDVDRGLAEAVAGKVGGVALSGDATARADVERLFAEAQDALGPITGIVDVVGVATIGAFADLDDAAWDRQFDLVLRHAFLVLQIGARRVADAGGGTIVFVGSISGERSIPQQAAYGAAKAGLHHLVSCLGGELAGAGVRVNAVAPGWIRTPRLTAKLGDAAWAEVDRMIPRGVAGTPSEIAGPVLFLSGRLSSYVTGQVLVADGGLTNASPHPDVFGTGKES